MIEHGGIDWRIGTMGFGYAEWAGVFYPAGVKSGDYLEHYARYFDAVELDTTFYATPPLDRVRKWAEVTSSAFRFAAKAPKAVTHDAPIDRGVRSMLEFLDVMARGLGEKLGVALLQFPPSFAAREAPKLSRFLGEMPNDIELAVEFRHESWWNHETALMLKDYRCAWVSAEYVAEPRTIVPTADLLYVRLIGEHGRFKEMNAVHVDVTANLRRWRDRLLAISPAPRSIWVLLNNDYSGYAIETARTFRAMLGLPEPQPQPSDAEVGGLFG